MNRQECIEKLHELSYTLKESSIGFWIDGRCGYFVAGYFDNLREVKKWLANKLKEQNHGQKRMYCRIKKHCGKV